MFLRDIWYLAAWSSDVRDGEVMARTIANEPLVFFRDEKGDVAALQDRCPHRLAPLSRGAVREGALTCGYHGLAFSGDGKCVGNPHGAVTNALTVRNFPVEERHAAIWVWLGDISKADVDLIPALNFIDAVAPEARVTGYLHTDANYQLMVDNIMDLSHADYLHPDSLGGGINTRTKGRVSEEDGAIAIKWHASNDELPPAQAQFMPGGERFGDFQNEVYWHAPGVMRQKVLFGPHGKLADQGITSWNAHVMTPETESTTHYLFCHTSDNVSADPSIAPKIKELLLFAFAQEDAPMIEAQQRLIGEREFLSMGPALLPTDAGAGRVRQRMNQLLSSQRSEGKIEDAIHSHAV